MTSNSITLTIDRNFQGNVCKQGLCDSRLFSSLKQWCYLRFSVETSENYSFHSKINNIFQDEWKIVAINWTARTSVMDMQNLQYVRLLYILKIPFCKRHTMMLSNFFQLQKYSLI